MIVAETYHPPTSNIQLDLIWSCRKGNSIKRLDTKFTVQKFTGLRAVKLLAVNTPLIATSIRSLHSSIAFARAQSQELHLSVAKVSLDWWFYCFETAFLNVSANMSKPLNLGFPPNKRIWASCNLRTWLIHCSTKRRLSQCRTKLHLAWSVACRPGENQYRAWSQQTVWLCKLHLLTPTLAYINRIQSLHPCLLNPHPWQVRHRWESILIHGLSSEFGTS